MPVCHEKKCVMIHIPKNAGTAVGLSLGLDYGGGHLTAQQLKKDGYNHWTGYHSPDTVHHVTIPDWDLYYKFAIVRNPFDRVVSNFEYILAKDSFWHAHNDQTPPDWNGSIHPPKSLHPEFASTRGKTFLEVVREIPRRDGNGWKHQHPFVLDENGNYMVEDLFGHEVLDDAMGVICKKLRIQRIPLQIINTSSRRPYQEYYCDESRALVAEHYKKDLALFAYEF